MLSPKRVKYRRVHRGRMKGTAHRGNKVSYGEFGIQALSPAWVTSNQIEAARVIQREAVRFGLRYSLTRALQRSRLKPVWVKVRAHLSTG